MDLGNEVCVLNPCKYKYSGGLQLKIKANEKILEQLEVDVKDYKNSFICLGHLHPIINGKISRKDCTSHWLKHNQLPEKFIVGTRVVPKTYKLCYYQKLQQLQKAELSQSALEEASTLASTSSFASASSSALTSTDVLSSMPVSMPVSKVLQDHNYFQVC
jgi:hypothetical protein